jgi:ATP-binding cassette subfamily B protein
LNETFLNSISPFLSVSSLFTFPSLIEGFVSKTSAMIFIMYPRAQVSAQRIAEVLDTKPSIKDGKVNSDETDKKGEIEFKNVSFKYPDGDDYVLKNISFTAHQGETVAIIGSTGSGKTTSAL